MKLFIIRHAESANNHLALDLTYDEYMHHRSVEPPLTELGVRQAEVLAQHLAQGPNPEQFREELSSPRSAYGITHLYCSPMLRALQTALPVAQALGLQPEIWIDIHEHGGMFLGNPRSDDGLTIHPGLTRTEILTDFPGYCLPDAISEDGWWNSGYEDMPGCYRTPRVWRAYYIDAPKKMPRPAWTNASP